MMFVDLNSFQIEWMHQTSLGWYFASNIVLPYLSAKANGVLLTLQRRKLMTVFLINNFSIILRKNIPIFCHFVDVAWTAAAANADDPRTIVIMIPSL